MSQTRIKVGNMSDFRDMLDRSITKEDVGVVNVNTKDQIFKVSNVSVRDFILKVLPLKVDSSNVLVMTAANLNEMEVANSSSLNTTLNEPPKTNLSHKMKRK